jgi:hypothetical protein
MTKAQMTLAAIACGAIPCAPAQAQVVAMPPVIESLVNNPADAYPRPIPQPFAADLAIRIGNGTRCEVTFEQVRLGGGLVWRPLVMCPDDLSGR